MSSRNIRCWFVDLIASSYVIVPVAFGALVAIADIIIRLWFHVER